MPYELKGYKILFIFTGLVMVLTLTMIMLTPLRIHMDNILYIIIGRLILEGNVPYVDFIEVNPPLIYYINVIPNLVARLLSVNPIPVFSLLVLGLVVWSILAIVRLLTNHQDPVEKTIVAAIAFAIALSSLRLWFNGDYGQREHLFITLFLPIFVLRWQRYRGQACKPAEAVLIGVMGSLGACIKPHFLLMPVAVEVYWLLKYRNPRHLFSPEMIGFISFGFVYALHFLLVLSEMRNGYIEFMQYLAAEGRYRAYGYWSFTDIVLDQPILLAIGLAPFVIRRRNETGEWNLLRSLGVLTLAGVGVCAIQQRGFYYHYIPAVTTALLMVSIALFETPFPSNTDSTTEGARSRTILRLIDPPRLLLQIGLLSVFLYWSGISLPNLQDLMQRRGIAGGSMLQTIMEYTEEGDSIFLQSTAVQPYRVIARTDRTLGATYLPAVTPVLAFVDLEYGPDSYDPDFPLDPMVEKYLTDLEEDIIERDPRLVVIENIRSGTACPNQFSLWEFLYHRGFIEGSVTPTFMRVIGDFGRTEVYRYIGPPPSEMEGPIFFGNELAIYAWELQQDTIVSACEQVTLRSWWQVEESMNERYHLLLVLTEEGQGIASTDGLPGNWGTRQWHEGARFVDERTLEIPCDISPGEYPLLIGVYDAETIDLLPVSYPGGTPIGEHYYVTTLTVE